MKDLKDILYVIIAVAAGLIFLWMLGNGIGWLKTRNDHQRQVCVEQTHDYPYCNEIW